MKEFIIKRSEWGKGCLLDYTGKKCCLGFIAEQSGYTREQIFGRRLPCYLDNRAGMPNDELTNTEQVKSFVYWGKFRADDFTFAPRSAENYFAWINDATWLTSEEKEKVLIEDAAKVGIKFIFVD